MDQGDEAGEEGTEKKAVGKITIKITGEQAMTKREAAKDLGKSMDTWLDFEYWAYLQLEARGEWSQERMTEVLENHRRAGRRMNEYNAKTYEQAEKMRGAGLTSEAISAYYRSRHDEQYKLLTAWRSLNGLPPESPDVVSPAPPVRQRGMENEEGWNCGFRISPFIEKREVKPENTAAYAIHVMGEIDALIRRKYGMGLLIEGGDGVVLAADGNGQIKASFTIALI